MGDLTEKNSAGATKIVGADPNSGSETFYANVSSEGELKISSFANISFIATNKTINTTESLASVGGSNLSNRKTLVIFNRGSQTIYYGPSGVDDTTGIAIEKDELITLDVGQNILVYLVTKTGNATVTIQELA